MNLDLWWIQILLNSHVWILNPKKRHSQRCHFLFTNHKGGSDLQFVDRAGLVSSPILRNKLLRRERREAFAVFTSCQRNFQGLVFIPKSKPANNSRSSDKCPVNFSFWPAKVYPGRTLWPCMSVAQISGKYLLSSSQYCGKNTVLCFVSTVSCIYTKAAA